MAGGSHNYGKKGIAVGKVFIAFALVIITLIWVYYMNQDFLPE